ncbi:hypothetical protein ACEN19_06830 [Corynebacterium auriscanis]
MADVAGAPQEIIDPATGQVEGRVGAEFVWEADLGGWGVESVVVCRSV